MPIVDKRPRSRIDIIEIMERWARYRHGREGGTGWPKQVMLGKLMDGMPGTGCPRCSGRGKVTIDAPGIARMRVDCPVCDGAGRVRLDPSAVKVNPALIPQTGSRGQYNDDPLSQKVDWLICTVIEEDERIVVMAEFTENGNRNRKIARIRITHAKFNDLLESALEKIAENLDFP
jgi:hypothetical protein